MGKKSKKQKEEVFDPAAYRPAVHPFFVETAPVDQRFPTVDLMRRCSHSYFEYHDCKYVQKHKPVPGKENVDCNWFMWVCHHICPLDYIKRWDEEIAKGTYGNAVRFGKRP